MEWYTLLSNIFRSYIKSKDATRDSIGLSIRIKDALAFCVSSALLHARWTSYISQYDHILASDTYDVVSVAVWILII